jgi:hypothetical protein
MADVFSRPQVLKNQAEPVFQKLWRHAFKRA